MPRRGFAYIRQRRYTVNRRKNHMKYKVVAYGIGATMATGLVFALPVAAETAPQCSVLPSSICANTTTANDTSSSPIIQILVWVLRILTGAIGIAAIGALVFAGILYSSAGNNTAQVTKAKTIIRDTVIGLVAYGFMFILLNWLIPGGIFG